MSATQDQLLRAYENAPEPIQEALTDGLAVDFILKVRDRYGLHVDTTQKVTEDIRNMVLGLLTPSDFLSSLAELGISSDTSRKITSDLNTEVFIPLRDLVRKDQPSAAVTPQPTSMPLVAKIRVADQKKELNAPEKLSIPPYNLIRPAEEVRTMEKDIALIKNPPEITPVAANRVSSMIQNIQSEHATPARVFQTASIPVQVPEHTLPPIPVQVEERPPREETTETGRDVPLVKEYTADPYREPI